jgi:hypothetical protein
VPGLPRGLADLPGVQTVVHHLTDGALCAVLPGAPAAGL